MAKRMTHCPHCGEKLRWSVQHWRKRKQAHIKAVVEKCEKINPEVAAEVQAMMEKSYEEKRLELFGDNVVLWKQ
jgi:hypothetical protein